MEHRKTFSVLLLLWGSLQGHAKISHRVISLQQVLYTELQTLEKSAFITHPSLASPNENVLSQLRSVFHEFERQNQECITAILRVLALVDHTLENTIQDCEKVFHLPSLDSDNVLFRDVTRPLLLRVEALCQHVASGDLNEIEPTMVAIEQEATSYRKRLDETKHNMQIILHDLSSMEDTFAISSKIDELYDEIEPLNSTLHESIMAATGNLLARQQEICDEILQVVRDTTDEADVLEVITYFTKFLHNETELLIEELSDQLYELFFETSNMMNFLQEDITNITLQLIEPPVESFLQNESSLKCLAKLGNHNAMQSVTQSVESMLQCLSIKNDPERPLRMAYYTLSETADDVQFMLQGILDCHQSTVREEYDAKVFESVENCLELTQIILEAMEEYVESKMDEIVLHVENAMYYKNLKMGICFYGRAREMMYTSASINHQYQTCNMENEMEL